MRIEIWIPGQPAPGGSKSVFRTASGRNVVTDSGGKRVKLWRSICEAYARKKMGTTPPLEGPLRVSFLFVIPRPANQFRSVKKCPVRRDDAPSWHIQAPDFTKLTRSTEDALTGIVWVDDAQIVGPIFEEPGGKGWSDDRTGGCYVTVETFE